MPAIPRPPSYSSYPSYSGSIASRDDLGPFQKFLDKPKPTRRRVFKKREEMPGRDESDPDWGRIGWQILEVFAAETLGTAMLLFFGCMGIVSWEKDLNLHPFQGAIVFSVVVATIIQIFGHITAAHLNPAVTVAFTVLGKVTPGMAVVYVLSECLGAVLGYGLLLVLTPSSIIQPQVDIGHCLTVPHHELTVAQALILEFLATCFLVLVVCACTDPRNKSNTDSTPLKFAATILALSLAVGPYTGASMNPARTLGPSLWCGKWESHWVYWVGPCLAGLFTPLFYLALFSRPNVLQESVMEEVPLNHVKTSPHSDSAR